MKRLSVSENRRLVILFLIVLLPPLINWFANAMPTDRAAIGSLIAALLSALLVFLQKLLLEIKEEK